MTGGRWVCVGSCHEVVAGRDRWADRLTDAAAYWCPECGGGAFCRSCLEGHLGGHESVLKEQYAKYLDAVARAGGQPPSYDTWRGWVADGAARGRDRT